MEFEVEEGGLAEIPEIEDGTYVAKFVGFEKRSIPVGNDTREVFVFRFDIEGQIVEGITTTRRTQKSKSAQWMKAIVGSEFKKINVEDYYGTQVIVTVQNKTRTYGDATVAIPRVVNVSPMPKKATKKTSTEQKKQSKANNADFSIEKAVLEE